MYPGKISERLRNGALISEGWVITMHIKKEKYINIYIYIYNCLRQRPHRALFRFVFSFFRECTFSKSSYGGIFIFCCF